ncbi:MAG: ABC transporter ATP-binding protein [Lachnospiraceae bacterium]|nr:ABC transporter ATP-binding protein [Lachnospiraceae bacterium]MDE7238862.1 ABC transporter ATP-binding protein [Lachnospiraceae bacterium]
MELKLEGITKSYNKGKTYAVNDFHAGFTPGVYGLLGPNGAGKSTLMNMITDNLDADSGSITLDGASIKEMGTTYRSLLGYMPQQQGVYDDFTGEKFLWYMAALKGLGRKDTKETIERILAVVNLQGDRYKKLKSYSGGMKQRILIAQALLNDPKILIMDEPTAGLDPKERIRIRNFISDISKDKIVLLATHVVSDVESISKEILIMKSGRVVRQGTPQELLSEMEHKVFEALVTPEERKEYEGAGFKIANVVLTADKVCLRVVSDIRPDIGEVHEVRPNLEDVYLYFVE